MARNTNRSNGATPSAAPSCATLNDIADNNLNLNLPHYVDTYQAEDEIDPMAVRAERQRLKSEMEGLEVHMTDYLRELGYDL